MREILFKAKRIDNGEWIAGDLIHEPFGTYIQSVVDGKRIKSKVVECTICQYTGLTDKNGNKIWENDVVEYLEGTGKIVFECGSFGIAFQDPIDWAEMESRILPVTGCDNKLYACENDNYISLWEIYWNFNDEENSTYMIEVLGNIFDNPELLKGEG